MIRNGYNQISYPALKTKREITKYINKAHTNVLQKVANQTQLQNFQNVPLTYNDFHSSLVYVIFIW